MKNFFTLVILLQIIAISSYAQHNAGVDCFGCHGNLTLGGTVFSDSNATTVAPGITLSIIDSLGVEAILNPSNSDGNIAYYQDIDGAFLVKSGNVLSRTWHSFPEQASCNTCHIQGGNESAIRTKRYHELHTRIPPDNDCMHCHHFPASMDITQLMTPGVLNALACKEKLYQGSIRRKEP